MQRGVASWVCVVVALLTAHAAAGTINTLTNLPGASYVPATVGVPSSTVVDILNVGSTNLVVSSVSMVGAPEFTVSTSAQPITIPPQGQISVTVSFTPTSNTGLLYSDLVIVSDDPSYPTVTLPFNGCAGPAAVSFDPPSFDFGLVATYSPELHARVVNTGCAALELSAITPSTSFYVYTVLGQEVLDPGESFPFLAYFTPNGSTGSITGAITATTNPANSAMLAVSGTGTLGYATPNFASLDFFSQVGKPATPRPVKLTNETTSSLDVQSIEVSHPALSLAGGATPPFTILPGGEATLQITCTPTALGPNNGTVTVVTSGQPTVISVTCTGARTLYVTYDNAAGIVPLGVKKGLAFGLAANGLDPLVIQSMTITGPAASDFVLDPQFAQLQVIPADEFIYSAQGIMFTPSQTGSRTATLTLETDAPFDPLVEIPLTGEGFIPQLQLSTDHVDFGPIVAGLPHTRSIFATNLGTSTFVARTETAGTFGADADGLDYKRELTIAPGATVEIVLGIRSNVLGEVTDALTIHVTEPPLVVPISAQVVEPTVVFEASTPELDFGSWPIGETSQELTVTLRNNSPSTIPFGRIATTNLAFQITSNRSLMLAPGETADVTVTFRETQPGSVTGELWVYMATWTYIGGPAPPVVARFPLRAHATPSSAPRAAEGNNGGGCSAGGNGVSLLLLLAAIPLLRRRRGQFAACALLLGCSDPSSPSPSSVESAPSTFVEAEPRPATTITVELPGRPDYGLLAFQDGNGAWQQAAIPAEGSTYQFVVHWSRYAIAWAHVEPDAAYGPVYRRGTVHYRSTDEAPVLAGDTLVPVPANAESVPATTTCEGWRAHSEWDAVDASLYTWRLTHTPRESCGNTRAQCVYQWHVTITASLLGDSPAFDQPDPSQLAAWPPGTRSDCVDGSYAVTVTAQ